MKQLETELITAILKSYKMAYSYLRLAPDRHFLDGEKHFAAAVFMENEILSKIKNRRLTNLAIAHIITNAFSAEIKSVIETDLGKRSYVELLYIIYESIPTLKQYEGGLNELY